MGYQNRVVGRISLNHFLHKNRWVINDELMATHGTQRKISLS